MDLTLMDIVRLLYADLRKTGLAPSLHDRKRWHTLLYALSTTNAPWSGLLGDIWFDWDGPYPTCPALTDILHALRVVYTAGNHHVDSDTLEYWNSEWVSIDPAVKPAFEAMSRLAAEMLSVYCTSYAHSLQSPDHRTGVLPD